MEASGGDNSSICVSCRICCEGTLFSHVDLEADETQDQFSELNLIPIKDGLKFNQPCVALDMRTGCTVYSKRPSVCKKFTCKLLNKFEEGSLTKKDASTVILKAQQLNENLKKEMSNAGLPSSSFINPRARFEYIKSELSSKEDRKKFTKIHLQRGILLMYLKKNFW